MKENPLWLYELKWRKAKKSYCKRHNIDSALVAEKALDEMGRFYPSSESQDAITCAAVYYEKHGFIVFSKETYLDSFSRLELKELTQLSVNGKVVHAVLTGVNKVETAEIIRFENGQVGIKRGYL